MKTPFQALTHLKKETIALFKLENHQTSWVVFLLFIGFLLRLKHLLENRSLWLDEAWVAISVTSRSYQQILQNYDIFPGFAYPPGFFTLIQKFLTVQLGNNETVLRLYPFVCSVTALVLFYFLIRKFLKDYILVLSLSLFALADPLVYYAAEVKQYSVDLLIAILLFLGANYLIKRQWIILDYILCAIIGSIILWISYPSMFILGAIAFVLFIKIYREKRWKEGRWFIFSILAWGISYSILYFTYLSKMVTNPDLLKLWHATLLTQTSFSWQTFMFLGNVFWDSFKNPCMVWPGIGVMLFILGVRRLFQIDFIKALLLFLPVILALLASFAGKYPFSGRLILFLMPSYFIFIALGVEAIAQYFHKYQKLIFVLFFIVLLVYPLKEACNRWIHGHSQVENRKVLDFFNQNYQSGDFIYVNTTGQMAFYYYASSLGYSQKFPRQLLGFFDGLQYGMKIGKFARYIGDQDGKRFIYFKNEYEILNEQGGFLQALVSNKDNANVVVESSFFDYPKTGRTWVFLSNAPEDDDAQINEIVLSSFDRRAKRILSFEGQGAGIYLYDIQ